MLCARYLRKSKCEILNNFTILYGSRRLGHIVCTSAWSIPSYFSLYQTAAAGKKLVRVKGRRRGETTAAEENAGELGQQAEEEEVRRLRHELEILRTELCSTRQTILRMHEREDRVKQRSVYTIRVYWNCDDVVRLQHEPIICGWQVVAGFLLDEYL